MLWRTAEDISEALGMVRLAFDLNPYVVSDAIADSFTIL